MEQSSWMTILIFGILHFLHSISSYKHIILVHGILSKGGAFVELENFITDAHPGTNITSLDIFDGVSSISPMWLQLPVFIHKVLPIMQQAEDGVHLVCHSQGGLICRGILEHMPNHNVDTFITLSSPLLGQFGVPEDMKKMFPYLNLTTDELSKWMYNTFAQDTFAIANYWKDPRPKFYNTYLKDCKFLTSLNNNPLAPDYNQSAADVMARKKNFLKIKHLVALGGKDDGVIDPWQSALYGYYDQNLDIVPMHKQEAFLQDWFGLRTLYEREAVTTYSIDGVGHHGWHKNKTVFDTYIKKWLT